MKEGAEEIAAWTSKHLRSKSASAASAASLDGGVSNRSNLLPVEDFSAETPVKANYDADGEGGDAPGDDNDAASGAALGQWTPRTPDMVRGRKALRRPHTTNDKLLSRANRRSSKSLDVPKLRLSPVDENATSRDEEDRVGAAAGPIAIAHVKSTDTVSDMPSESDVSAAEEDHQDENEDKSDEVVVIFREKWAEKEKRIRAQSPYGSCKGWRLVPVIVKSNDDLRQEQFAYQLILQFQRIFKQAHGNLLWLRPYSILATSENAGLIEAVPDTISLDALKKKSPNYVSLNTFFERYHGKGRALRKAKRRFCKSLASYCVVCYLLQIKDRHNGNILIDSKGHIIHIDFGFLLTSSPGGGWVNFESAPFKLTNEFVEVLGGPDSRLFQRFRRLCTLAYLAARKSREQIILLVEMMLSGNENLACFQAGGRVAIDALRSRFNPKMTSRECEDFVDSLINTSINHWTTRWYDKYQRCCVGIL